MKIVCLYLQLQPQHQLAAHWQPLLLQQQAPLHLLRSPNQLRRPQLHLQSRQAPKHCQQLQALLSLTPTQASQLQPPLPRLRSPSPRRQQLPPQLQQPLPQLQRSSWLCGTLPWLAWASRPQLSLL